ncbi:hypothetical protein [Pigmentiphaga litoralis]|uniref:hypothetical protein n=1 Tax=Pigmentiphaga litoralis TaxID=516702 RepID=UPI003B4289A4
MKRIAIALVSTLALAACGGGGGDGESNSVTPTPSNQDAAGLYGTTATGLVGSTIIFNDGSYYSIYGTPTQTNGFITGTGTASNGTFTSTNAKDFSAGAVVNATISASYLAKRSISGSVTYTAPARSVPFTGNYDAFYEAAPNLANLAGRFTGPAASPIAAEQISVNILATGAFSGQGPSGCTFTGTASPKASGNAYDVLLNFGATACVYPSQQVRGVAVVRNNQLVVMVTTADRNGGLIFLGNKN